MYGELVADRCLESMSRKRGTRYETRELVDESLQLLEARAKRVGRGLCEHDVEVVGHTANDVRTVREQSPEAVELARDDVDATRDTKYGHPGVNTSELSPPNSALTLEAWGESHEESSARS